MNKLILKACQALTQADAVLIGASNGLSIAEGYHLFACNDMYQHQFGDFLQQYGIRNVIEGCFFPDPQIRREFLQRLIHHWVETYQPSQVMKDLLALIQHKDYFILTTNADTHLELSGMDPNRIFEMEGPLYKLFRELPSQTKVVRCNPSSLVTTGNGWSYWNWASAGTTASSSNRSCNWRPVNRMQPTSP